MAWKKGQRVYNRSRGFFGRVAEDEKDGKVLINRGAPWDPKAPPDEVDVTDVTKVEAEVEDVVRRRYGTW